jgi:hypothetical protein
MEETLFYNFVHFYLTTSIQMAAATSHPKVVGRILFSQEEFQSWLKENTPALNGMGLRLNTDVYNEVYKALSVRRDDHVAIVPQFDLVDAEHLITDLSKLSEASKHTITDEVKKLKQQ